MTRAPGAGRGFVALPAGLQGIGAVVVGGRLLLPGGGPAAGGAQQSDRLLVLSAG